MLGIDLAPPSKPSYPAEQIGNQDRKSSDGNAIAHPLDRRAVEFESDLGWIRHVLAQRHIHEAEPSSVDGGRPAVDGCVPVRKRTLFEEDPGSWRRDHNSAQLGIYKGRAESW